MNVLELRLDASDDAYGLEVRVLIDGRDLVELARSCAVLWRAPAR